MGDILCKCCGQTLPAIEGVEIVLSAGLRNLVQTVRLAGPHGIDTNRLFDKLYDGDLDGGPLSGHKALHVRVHQVNKRLRPHGWRIVGNRTDSETGYGRYKLLRLAEAAE